MSQKLPGIYALQDPRTYEIRYVGLGKDWKKRTQEHMMPSRLKRDVPVYIWIKKVTRLGYKPIIICIQEFYKISNKDLGLAEQHWIKYFKNQGCDLLNCTDGGEGVLDVSVKTREKLSLSATGVVFTEERRRKIGEKSKGRKAFLGRHHSEETKKKLSEQRVRNKSPWFGKTHTEETKVKMRNSSRVKKPIIDQLGNLYPSVSEAGRRLNVSPKLIDKVLHNRITQTHGYQFKYAEGDIF